MRNTLNSYIKQEKTKVSETKPIGFDSLSSIFILHAIFIGIAIVYQTIKIVLRLRYVQEKLVKPLNGWFKSTWLFKRVLSKLKKRTSSAKIDIEYLSSPVPPSPSTELTLSTTATTDTKSTSSASGSKLEPTKASKSIRRQPTNYPHFTRQAKLNSTLSELRSNHQDSYIMMSSMNNSSLLRLSRIRLNRP